MSRSSHSTMSGGSYHVEWATEVFSMADKKNRGKVKLKDAVNGLHKANFVSTKREIKRIVKAHDRKQKAANVGATTTPLRSKCINLERFTQVMKEILHPRALEKLIVPHGIKDLEGAATHFDAEHLASFFKLEQREDMTISKAEALILKATSGNGAGVDRSDDHHHTTGMIDHLSLIEMLSTPEFELFDHERLRFGSHSMEHPLSHYYIDSSHNTYLLRDQVIGLSSTEAYVNALKAGCRCVELDCWDDDEGKEPIIYHGHTLTSKISFTSVIETIAKWAFYASDYPLILSIENHCTKPCMERMYEIMTNVLGDTLCRDTVDESKSRLPSPYALKRKILIKAKGSLVKGTPSDDTENDTEDEDEDENEDAMIDALRGLESSNAPQKKKLKKAKRKFKKKKATPTVKLDAQLGSLINYITGTSFKSFEHSKTEGKYYLMSSFSEAKAHRLATNNTKEFAEYNERQLSRIYPSGLRISSSNYMPTTMWNAGCQIVALNYQTSTLPMWLNAGKFAENGGCGYVLKPRFLREAKLAAGFDQSDPGDAYKNPQLLTIEVLCATGLPKPTKKNRSETIDPFVECSIHGIESQNTTHRTSRINNNGLHPDWTTSRHHKVFEFHVDVPEVTMVHFQIQDHDASNFDDYICHYSLPMSAMKQGIRCFHPKRRGESLVNTRVWVRVRMDPCQ